MKAQDQGPLLGLCNVCFNPVARNARQYTTHLACTTVVMKTHPEDLPVMALSSLHLAGIDSVNSSVKLKH